MGGRECSICSSPACEQVAVELKTGTSVRSIASLHGFSRAAVHRHSRNCLKLRTNASLEAIEEAKAKHTLISSDLDEAFASAEKLKAKAEASGDMAALIKAERHLARLIGLRQRQAGRLPSEIKAAVLDPNSWKAKRARGEQLKTAVVFEWPSDPPYAEARERFPSSTPQQQAEADLVYRVSFVKRLPVDDSIRPKPDPIASAIEEVNANGGLTKSDDEDPN